MTTERPASTARTPKELTFVRAEMEQLLNNHVLTRALGEEGTFRRALWMVGLRRYKDAASLEMFLDGIWNLIVNVVRPVWQQYGDEVGEVAAQVLKDSVHLRVVWPAILESGRFSREDSRIAGVEAFLSRGVSTFSCDVTAED